jgi:Gam-like protein
MMDHVATMPDEGPPVVASAFDRCPTCHAALLGDEGGQCPFCRASLGAASAPPADALEPLPDNEPELLVYANRLLRETAEVDQERAANAAALRIEADRLKTLYEDLDGPLARRRDVLARELARIYDALPRRGKAKSRKLAFGVIGTRAKAARVVVDDQDALTVALKEHVEPGVYELIVRRVTEEKVDLRALTNYVAANQWQPLPGTTIVEARDDFFAKTGEHTDLRDYDRD